MDVEIALIRGIGNTIPRNRGANRHPKIHQSLGKLEVAGEKLGVSVQYQPIIEGVELSSPGGLGVLKSKALRI